MLTEEIKCHRKLFGILQIFGDEHWNPTAGHNYATKINFGAIFEFKFLNKMPIDIPILIKMICGFQNNTEDAYFWPQKPLDKTSLGHTKWLFGQTFCLSALLWREKRLTAGNLLRAQQIESQGNSPEGMDKLCRWHKQIVGDEMSKKCEKWQKMCLK